MELYQQKCNALASVDRLEVNLRLAYQRSFQEADRPELVAFLT